MRKNLIALGIVIAASVTLPATPLSAQDSGLCRESRKTGCVLMCLEGKRWERIVEYRKERGQEPKWRPWICTTNDVRTGACEHVEWAYGPCARACGKAGEFAVYRRAADRRWPDGKKSISCAIKG